MTNDGLRELTLVTNLRDLTVSETAVSTEGLRYLAGLQRLVRVCNHDWSCYQIPEVEAYKKRRNSRFLRLSADQRRVEAIRALKTITGYLPPDEQGRYSLVSLSQSGASDADLVYLVAVPEIEELDLFECMSVTAAGLKHLAALKKLRVLRLSNTGVKDLSPLKYVENLEDLEADSLEGLDPRSVRSLSKLKNLRRLTLRFCNLDDALMPQLARLAELRELDIIYNDVTPCGVRELLALKKLEKLEFDCPDQCGELVAQILRK